MLNTYKIAGFRPSARLVIYEADQTKDGIVTLIAWHEDDIRGNAGNGPQGD